MMPGEKQLFCTWHYNLTT